MSVLICVWLYLIIIIIYSFKLYFRFGEKWKTDASMMFPFKWHVGSGHYTAMVWARTYKIGCGLIKRKVEIFGTQVWIICNYAPSGNMVNSHMNVFEPSSSVASSCMPGSAPGPSHLCEITDEAEYRKHVGLDTVPPSQ